MATKLMVPRPGAIKKVQPQEIALDVNDLVEEEADNTEPSTAPPVHVADVHVAEVPPPPAFVMAASAKLPGVLIGPPAPISTVTLGPARPSSPAPVAARDVAMSLPSQFELDSERKSSPPVAQRRKELAKYVASAVGVAWFICTCAIGETALRSIIGSMH